MALHKGGTTRVERSILKNKKKRLKQPQVDCKCVFRKRSERSWESGVSKINIPVPSSPGFSGVGGGGVNSTGSGNGAVGTRWWELGRGIRRWEWGGGRTGADPSPGPFPSYGWHPRLGPELRLMKRLLSKVPVNWYRNRPQGQQLGEWVLLWKAGRHPGGRAPGDASEVTSQGPASPSLLGF